MKKYKVYSAVFAIVALVLVFTLWNSQNVASAIKNTAVGRDGKCPDFVVDGTDTNLPSHSFEQSSPFTDEGIQVATNQGVLILSSIKNAGLYLDNYFKMLCSLTYPQELISIGLMEESSEDDTFELASKYVEMLQGSFRRVELFRQEVPSDEIEGNGKQDEKEHLAKSRNILMSKMLRDETWLLWLDADIGVIPEDLIQHLLSAQKPIVAPACVYEQSQADKTSYEVYDRNSWRKSPKGESSSDNADNLMQAIYAPSNRMFLPHIRNDGRVVSLDSVGTCVLLVSAEKHREGLIFPPFAFPSPLENIDSFSRLATLLNIPLYGLPYVTVLHQ